MEIIPSVDISGGKVVRLQMGRADLRKTYSDNPLSVANRWKEEGAKTLHVVDIDAAKGVGENGEEVRKILKYSSLKVQVGGGIRSLESAKKLIEDGAERIVVGTIAFQRPDILSSMLSGIGNDRVVIALDYVGEEVMVGGWDRRSEVNLLQALRRFEGFGVNWFLLTSVERDGMMVGPDIDTLKTVRKLTRRRVLASGGSRGIQDLLALKRTGVDGVVIGKALYEEKITLSEVMKALSLR